MASIPSLSLRDNLIFNLAYLVPLGLQGSFTRNRRWVGLMARLHPDPAAVKLIARLRAAYGSEYLYLKMLTTKTLLVLDPAGVQHILDHSPDIYADGKPKRDGMRVFQPRAVTISRGEDWRDRRRFNEGVLGFGCPVHPDAHHILQVIREEVADERHDLDDGRWTWEHFDALFGRISRRVIFGDAARDDTTITELLHTLMMQANQPIKPPRSTFFGPFYRRLDGYLKRAAPGSLAARCHQIVSTRRTQVDNQLPHWMFAMWETLASNVARALAAILTHPQVEQRVRHELANADLATPGGIASLNYLGACLQDAMRLWPTTPMLVRETIGPDRLGGESIPPGTQILIWNSPNHRDPARYPFADAFVPEAWVHGRPSVLFNHLSSGPQVCAGIDLLLFIGRAVVAAMLAEYRYTVRQPALDPGEPLPYAFDHFRIQLAPA
jgi:cytochrome P450